MATLQRGIGVPPESKQALASAESAAEPRRADGATLRIAQINLKKSEKRLKALFRFVRKMPMPRRWDIIAIQDPPGQIATRRSSAYDLWYRPTPPQQGDSQASSQAKPDPTHVPAWPASPFTSSGTR